MLVQHVRTYVGYLYGSYWLPLCVVVMHPTKPNTCKPP